MLPCLVQVVSSTIQASAQISETNRQKQTKIMVMESEEKEYSKAKKAYDQYQKLRRFYFQEEEIANGCRLMPNQKEAVYCR